MTGRLPTGTIGFGTSYVSGRSRVPSPAAITIALIARAGYPRARLSRSDARAVASCAIEYGGKHDRHQD